MFWNHIYNTNCKIGDCRHIKIHVFSVVVVPITAKFLLELNLLIPSLIIRSPSAGLSLDPLFVSSVGIKSQFPLKHSSLTMSPNQIIICVSVVTLILINRNVFCLLQRIRYSSKMLTAKNKPEVDLSN